MDRKNFITDVVYTISTKDTRAYGTVGHENARKYIELKMAEVGLQHFDVGQNQALKGEQDGFTFHYQSPYRRKSDPRISNVVGFKAGSDPDAEPIVVGGHYDSAERAPGADDNAGSVAVMLSAAREYQGGKHPVIFLAFDTEEPPFFGTEYMGSNLFRTSLRARPHFAIIMDMLGHPKTCDGELCNIVYVSGLNSDQQAADLSTVESENIWPYPMAEKAIGDLSDHATFRKSHTPYVLLQCGHNSAIHSPADIPEVLDYDRLSAIAGYVVKLIEKADQSPRWTPQPRDSIDPERSMIERVASKYPTFERAQVTSHREHMLFSQELFRCF